MWRRLYLILVLVRLYFALSPSYIHPDEHFQGPEVIAGEVFGYPVYKTWEFTSSQPIRSIFPFWIVYGWPLTVLKWLWEGLGYGPVPPNIAFYGLRTLMFLLNFVLGDWAIHELLPVPAEHRLAVTLFASSYVTWTYQSHTFSNSIETLIVLWCLVCIGRLRENTQRTMASACIVLAFLGVLGVFNRITFPAYLVVPSLQLLPTLYLKPMRLPIMLFVALVTLATAITMDTEFYTSRRPQIRGLFRTSTITPLNNLMYNLDASNLAEHGLHPLWQHFLANLPQLLGPAFPLLFFSSRRSTLFWSGLSGVAVLSCFRHQEARFLLPAVPLFLCSLRIHKRWARTWVGAWIIFNLLAGALFGIYHQGGVVPVQTWIAQHGDIGLGGNVFWWKTYSPPRWLLNGRNNEVTTSDLMGMSGVQMLDRMRDSTPCESTDGGNETLLVAPWSATFLDPYVGSTSMLAGSDNDVILDQVWKYRGHIGLDDLDFADDGVLPTLQRVLGRRGLVIWRVHRKC